MSKKNGVGMSNWWLLEQVLAQWWWWHPVASSEALDLLHWAVRAVLYRRITMTIKTARKAGVLIHWCVVDCRPDVRRSNAEQVVARCGVQWLPIWWHKPNLCTVQIHTLGAPGIRPDARRVSKARRLVNLVRRWCGIHTTSSRWHGIHTTSSPYCRTAVEDCIPM